MASHPNVVLIMVDQMRYDCAGFAGHPAAQTPALDRIAAEGVRFENAYCGSPVCSPARASWLTGLYPHGHGLLGNYGLKRAGMAGYFLPRDVPTLGDAFKAAGYRCGMVGPWHMGDDDVAGQHGFSDLWMATRYNRQENDPHRADLQQRNLLELYRKEHNLKPKPYTHFDLPGGPIDLPVGVTAVPNDMQRTTWTVDRGMEFIREQDARPYLLFLSIKDPHPELLPPPEALARYRLEDIPAPAHWDDPLLGKPPSTAPNNRVAPKFGLEGLRIYAMYYLALLTHVDTQLARFMAALKQSGKDRDTVVAFISDHGEMLGEHGMIHKQVMYEGSVRVPCLLRWPGALPAGAVVREPLAGVDLMPTLLDLAGAAPCAPVHGRSVASAILSGTEPAEATVFSEIGTQIGINTPEAPREQRAFVVMARHGRWKYVLYRDGEHELYDLHSDAGEMSNLAGLPNQAARVAEMRRRIREELRPSGDYNWAAK